MIRVKIFERSGKIIGFSYKGHAGYADYPNDIVCAGVSAQLMMAYNGLEEILKVPMKMDMDDDGGRLEFRLSEYTEEELEKSQIIMETLKLGLLGIEAQYKANITLKEEEV